jgi:ribosomal protein L12E/L44/L45/RPP1/RPP2
VRSIASSTPLRVGSRVQAQFSGQRLWSTGTVTAISADGCLDIQYDGRIHENRAEWTRLIAKEKDLASVFRTAERPQFQFPPAPAAEQKSAAAAQQVERQAAAANSELRACGSSVG